MRVIISCKQCSCTVQVVSTPQFQLQPKSSLLNATKMQVLKNLTDYVRYGDKVNVKFLEISVQSFVTPYVALQWLACSYEYASVVYDMISHAFTIFCCHMLLYIISGASTKSSSNQESGFQPAARNIIERKRLGITNSHACIVVYIYL